MSSGGLDAFENVRFYSNTTHNKSTLKDDFSWRSLDDKWSKKLLSGQFIEKDCIGDGNCQFRSIETALTNAGYKTNYAKLRNQVAKYIRSMPSEEFSSIIQSYALEKQNNEFHGGWDPYAIRNKYDFIRVIKQPGFVFEGDNVTLALLTKALKIDFVVFGDNYVINDLTNTQTPNERIILLMYTRIGNTGHYKTIGLQTPNGKVTTIFKRQKLPLELQIIFDKYKWYTEHIHKITNNMKHPKLMHILTELESCLQTQLSRDDKRMAMKIIHVVIQNVKYHRSII